MSCSQSCSQCRFYTFNAYLACAVHPERGDSLGCPDYQEREESQQAQWSPTGWRFFGGQLVKALEGREAVGMVVGDGVSYCPRCGWEDGWAGTCRACDYQRFSSNRIGKSS